MQNGIQLFNPKKAFVRNIIHVKRKHDPIMKQDTFEMLRNIHPVVSEEEAGLFFRYHRDENQLPTFHRILFWRALQHVLSLHSKTPCDLASNLIFREFRIFNQIMWSQQTDLLKITVLMRFRTQTPTTKSKTFAKLANISKVTGLRIHRVGIMCRTAVKASKGSKDPNQTAQNHTAHYRHCQKNGTLHTANKLYWGFACLFK